MKFVAFMHPAVSWLTFFHLHIHAICRALNENLRHFQGYFRLSTSYEPVHLQHVDDDDLHLQQSQAVGNAVPRSCSEWYVGQLMTGSLPVWSKPEDFCNRNINSLAPGKFGSNFKSMIFKFIIQNDNLVTCSDITLIQNPKNFTNAKSTLV